MGLKWWYDTGSDTTCSAAGQFRNGITNLNPAGNTGTPGVNLTISLDALIPETASAYIGNAGATRAIGTTPRNIPFSVDISAVTNAALNVRIQEGDGSCGAFEESSVSANLNTVAVHTGTLTGDKDASGNEEAILMTSVDQGAHGSRSIDFDYGDGYDTWVILPEDLSQSAAGTVTPSGAKSASLSRTVAGALTSAGGISRAVQAVVEGVLTTAGAPLRAVAVTVAGALSLAGSMARVITGVRTVVGGLTPGGTMTRVLTAYRSFLGGLDFSGIPWRLWSQNRLTLVGKVTPGGGTGDVQPAGGPATEAGAPPSTGAGRNPRNVTRDKSLAAVANWGAPQEIRKRK